MYKKSFILFLSGSLMGKFFQLTGGTILLGNSKGVDIFVDDDVLSNRYIAITVLRALGNKYCVYVNDEKITETILHNEDKIQISPTTKFKMACVNEDEQLAFDLLIEKLK